MSDLVALSPDVDLQSSDSIYITLPPSLSLLLDLSLPPSSSSSENLNSLYSAKQRCSPVFPTCSDCHSMFPADSGMPNPLMLSFVRPLIVSMTLDLDIITHDPYSHVGEPISTVLPPSNSWIFDPSLPLPLPDLSLPPPPSPSEDSDFDINLNYPDVSLSTVAGPLKANHEPTGMCLIERFPEK